MGVQRVRRLSYEIPEGHRRYAVGPHHLPFRGGKDTLRCRCWQQG